MGRAFKVKLGILAAILVVIVGGAGVAVTARASAVAPGELPGRAAAVEQEHQNAGWIGIAIANLNEKLAQRLGLTRTTGVVILRVMPGSPAEKAGLKAKDLITQVGTAVSDVKGVHQAIAVLKVGDTVTITVLREGQDTPVTVTVTVAQRPQPPPGPHGQGPRRGPALFGLLPFRLEELQGIPPGQWFSHFLSAQYALTDKDGKAITVTVAGGTITAKSDQSLTVQLNGAGAGTKTYTVTGATKVLGKGGKLENLVAGDQVLVVTVGTSNEARYIVRVPQPQPQGSPAPGQPQSFRAPFDPQGFGGMQLPEDLRERLDGMFREFGRDRGRDAPDFRQRRDNFAPEFRRPFPPDEYRRPLPPAPPQVPAEGL